MKSIQLNNNCASVWVNRRVEGWWRWLNDVEKLRIDFIVIYFDVCSLNCRSSKQFWELFRYYWSSEKLIQNYLNFHIILPCHLLLFVLLKKAFSLDYLEKSLWTASTHRLSKGMHFIKDSSWYKASYFGVLWSDFEDHQFGSCAERNGRVNWMSLYLLYSRYHV